MFMRFYEECVQIAKSVGAIMSESRLKRFTETPVEDWYYHLALWIRHVLPQPCYLREALTVLGYRSDEEMSRFLVEFTQRYWKLVYAEMM